MKESFWSRIMARYFAAGTVVILESLKGMVKSGARLPLIVGAVDLVAKKESPRRFLQARVS